MRRTNRVVTVFLLASLLTLPVAANAWFEIDLRCSVGQNIPGDPDTPLPNTDRSGRDSMESFDEIDPGFSFVTILESAFFAVLQTPCVGL